MYSYYLDFLSHYYQPNDERYQALAEAGKKILVDHPGELEAIISEMYQNGCRIKPTEEKRKALAQAAGVHFFTLNHVFLSCATKEVKDIYLKRGYGEALFYETFEDFCYKLEECHDIFGVWGNFVEFWYPIFYQVKCFKLGRLEFEICGYHKDEPYSHGGITLKKGDPILSVHIPSGAPLTKESRMDSYRRAYAFFPECIHEGKLAMVCDSWLMFAGNRDIFPPSSNIHQFLDDWHIIHSEEDPAYRDAWRLFSCKYEGNPDALPQNSSARRAMVNWLKSGKYSGVGYAVTFFDGQHLCPAKNGNAQYT